MLIYLSILLVPREEDQQGIMRRWTSITTYVRDETRYCAAVDGFEFCEKDDKILVNPCRFVTGQLLRRDVYAMFEREVSCRLFRAPPHEPEMARHHFMFVLSLRLHYYPSLFFFLHCFRLILHLG